jgi:hypothetical protein
MSVSIHSFQTSTREIPRAECIAHRLLAALGLAVFLAPGYDESLKPLLEVLDAKKTVEGRIKLYKKKEVKKLAEDIAKIC